MSRLLTVTIAFLLLAGSAVAQAAKPGPRAMGKRPGPGRRAIIVDRWNRMSPEERDKALGKLPPARREHIERQLERYNNLTPEERRELRQRYETFNQLPPVRQEQARKLFRRFSMLPAERRQPLREEFDSLRAMPEADRRARLNSDEFRGKYSGREQDLLRDLTGLLSPATPEQ